jgi:hypothetical protein
MARGKKDETVKAPASPDFFQEAKSLSPMVPVTTSKVKDTIEFGESLDRLAAITVMQEALKDLGNQLDREIKDRAMSVFANKALETKSHTSSLAGQGNQTSASIEMRKRASNQPIPGNVLEQLRTHGIPFEKKVTVSERFVFNSDLLANEDIRRAISEAFVAHPTLKPLADSLIKKQPEEYHWSTSADSLQKAAENLSREDYLSLVPSISSLAVCKILLDGEETKEGKGDDRTVTPKAKAIAISMLQEMGVFPAAAAVAATKKKK